VPVFGYSVVPVMNLASARHPTGNTVTSTARRLKPDNRITEHRHRRRHRLRIAGFVLILLSGAGSAQATPPPLFIVHFETGPRWDASLEPNEQAGFREHSENLKGLREEGRIVFGARYDEFGVVFLRAGSLDAARAMIEKDPGVLAGIFVFRIAPLRVFYAWEAQADSAAIQ
jgi:uncharacterized protein YciI